jgi:hypothetical protein
MSSFDTRPAYNAEASHFTATIKAGNLKWTAVIDWKEANKFADPLSFNAQPRTTGKYAGAKVIHATSEDALRKQLRQIDPSVKFVAAAHKTTALGTSITKLSDSDAKMLEGMRVDPDVSDIVYNRACRQFGAPPQKRPDFTVAPAVVEKSPYSEKEQGELNHAFLRIFLDKKHPELRESGHEAFNKKVLLRWHADSGLSILTMASLDRAFQECSALQFFRSALSGTRTRGQSDSNVVRSYSFDAIQAYRRSDEPAQPVQPPASGRPEKAAANARVLRLAKNQVRQLHPSWNEKSGEFNKSVTEVIRSWAINENPNLAKKSGHF